MATRSTTSARPTQSSMDTESSRSLANPRAAGPRFFISDIDRAFQVGARLDHVVQGMRRTTGVSARVRRENRSSRPQNRGNAIFAPVKSLAREDDTNAAATTRVSAFETSRETLEMKLLIASSAPADGGAGISAYARVLASTLAGAGHEIHYASPSHRDARFLDEHGIRHCPTEREQDAREAAERLLAYVRDHAIEGCINNDNPVLQNLAPALTIPLVVVCHMDRRSVGSLCRIHADWVDHLVCISNDMQRTMVRRYGFPNTKCRLIHNGTHDPGHSGDFAQRDPERLRVVVTGGYNAHKGGTRVLASMRDHPDAWRGVQVDWFGPVPDEKRAQAASLDVEFHGQVPQARFHEVLGQADVLVFASNKEGCPMTMLEAMAHGVLPIATDGVGAMRWLIDSGREGFICHLRDFPHQLADCIAFLGSHSDLTTAMKRAARERYLRDFRADTNAERILQLVRQPTVDRTARPDRFEIVEWHRPVASPTRPITLMDRIRYRTGWLARAGTLEPPRD